MKMKVAVDKYFGGASLLRFVQLLWSSFDNHNTPVLTRSSKEKYKIVQK